MPLPQFIPHSGTGGLSSNVPVRHVDTSDVFPCGLGVLEKALRRRRGMQGLTCLDFGGRSGYIFGLRSIRSLTESWKHWKNPQIMASTSNFRTGMVIRMDGELLTVVAFQHVNPGNWRAFVRTKLKNLRTGRVIENRFRAGESIDVVRIDRREFQHLYRDSSGYVFMDKESFEQIVVPEGQIGEGAKFLRPNEEIEILFDGTEVVGIELPTSVELTVSETVPGVKGDTATGGTKPATLETGTVVQVPLFINEGDLIKVDTRSGVYIERVKAA